MKTIYKLLLSLTVLVFITSCEDTKDVYTYTGGTVTHFTSSTGSHGAKSSADTYSVEVATTSTAAATVAISVSASSTAIEGVHFETLPTSVSIAAGAFVSSFAVVPLVEGITPGEPVMLVIDIANSTVVGMPQTFTLSLDRICDPLPGDWIVDMHDSWGDGWQTTESGGGDPMTITLDDGTVLEAMLADGFEGTATVTIPVGTTKATWYFPGDYYGEISFEIYGPDASLVYSSPLASPAGELPVVLCAP